MIDLILDFDLSVLKWLDAIRCGFLDGVFGFITHLGDKGILWIALGIILILTPKYKRAGGCILLALLINFVAVNLMIKPLVARTRPYDLVEGINLVISAPHDYSFPSGHTSAAFATAAAIAFCNKKWGMAALVLAALIGFSRLYLYVHYPTDVIAGALLGIGAACIAVRIADKYRELRSR